MSETTCVGIDPVELFQVFNWTCGGQSCNNSVITQTRTAKNTKHLIIVREQFFYRVRMFLYDFPIYKYTFFCSYTGVQFEANVVDGN